LHDRDQSGECQAHAVKSELLLRAALQCRFGRLGDCGGRSERQGLTTRTNDLRERLNRPVNTLSTTNDRRCEARAVVASLNSAMVIFTGFPALETAAKGQRRSVDAVRALLAIGAREARAVQH